MPSRFLDVIAPFCSLIPEFGGPRREILFPEKVLWSAVTVAIFMVLSRVSILGYWETGIYKSGDSFYWTRGIVASDRGTLTELGFAPFMVTCSILHLLACTHVIQVNDTPTDRSNFNKAQMCFGIILTVLQVIFMVVSGANDSASSRYYTFDPPEKETSMDQPIKWGTRALIGTQLALVGFLIIYVEQMVTKGYGLGSGMAMCIAANVSWTILWNSFGPVITNTGRGPEYFGAVPGLVHNLATWPNKMTALRISLYRSNLPNLFGFFFTLPVFIAIIFVQALGVGAARSSWTDYSGQYRSYPLGLFYTSRIPLVLFCGLVSSWFFASEVLARALGNENLVVRLLGEWKQPEHGAGDPWYPTGGLSYYFTAHVKVLQQYLEKCLPRDLSGWAKISATYLAVLVGSCIVLSKSWMRRYTPIFGGIFVVAASVITDVIGWSYVPGTAILLAGTIIAHYTSILLAEQREDQVMREMLLGYG